MSHFLHGKKYSPEYLDLLSHIFTSEKERYSAREILSHPFFDEVKYALPPSPSPLSFLSSPTPSLAPSLSLNQQ